MKTIITNDQKLDGCGECIYLNKPNKCKECALPTGKHYESEISLHYKEYLKLPLATCDNPNTEIYIKRWCKITGLSFRQPDLHRHYTMEEFEDKLNSDTEFKNRFIN